MSGTRASPVRVLWVAGGGGDSGPDFAAALERASDFEVVPASSVGEALERVAEGVDCVASEHRDGGIDGLELLESVREVAPDLPFVLVPAAGDESLAAGAIAAGVTGYVPSTDDDRGASLRTQVRDAVGVSPPARPDGTARLPIDELDLRERLRLKERAMEEAPVGITISDPDRPDNPLIYANDAFERLTGYEKEAIVGRNCRFLQGEESDPEAIAAMRAAVDDAEPVSVELVNYRDDGSTFWNRVHIAPIRDDDGTVTNYVGFQTDVTTRKEAELEVQRERENLDHLLSRINGLMQDVTAALVRATSREEVERALCERVAGTDSCEYCWIGTRDIARDALVPSAEAGTLSPSAEDLDLDLDLDARAGESDRSPTVRAAETRTAQVVQDPDELAALVADRPWLDGSDVGGVAAVPLVYGETLYGVLTVYAPDREDLNERETVVLEALARAAATALNALERGRMLASDNVVELEFEVRDRALFVVDLSAAEDCRLEYEGAVTHDDGSTLMFFSTDATPEAVEARAAAHPEVEDVTLVKGGDDENLFEVAVSGGSLVGLLAARGARLTTFRVESGVGRVTVEHSTGADARAIVEQLAERYDGTELVAYRETERPPETRQEFIADLRDRLTERQLTALQAAYLGGFYEWNRSISGDELAESMGVARSTFHQHLRAAERKLVSEFFDQ
ncbi:MAG: bacterio-opsin activator domain-containing protein [Haloferacaceae archaeon]